MAKKKQDPTSVWVKKNDSKIPGFNIGSLMRAKSVSGDVGIEIEVEGNKFPKPPGSHGTLTPVEMPDHEGWSYVHDGSLRGQDNAEYVLTKPIKFQQVPEAITKLWEQFKAYGSKLDESNRTSVHVHLNAQQFHLNRVAAFCGLYFSVEEILTEWCGDHRVGNLFCLRAKDAPAIVSKLKAFIQEEGKGGLSEGLHYGGLNIHALTKFGSIEIRALRGCTDPQTIIDWVSILERIYRLSGEYTDPRDVCNGFSGEGPMAYLEKVLGDKTNLVRSSIGFDNQRVMESLYEGIRLAQDICYCRDWSLYEPMDINPDPFKRDIAKVAESLNLYNTIASQPNPVYYATSPAPPSPAVVPVGWDAPPPTEAWLHDDPEPEYDEDHCGDPDCEECN